MILTQTTSDRHLFIPPTIRARSAGMGAFQPSDLSGLKLWLKADAITGLSDGDLISTFPDASGNAWDFTGSGAARPTYKTAIKNSLPIARFDGNDLMFAPAGALSAWRNISGGTIFIVAAAATTAAEADAFFVATNVANSTRAAVIFGRSGAGNISAGGRRLDADSFAFAQTSGITNGAWNLIGQVYDYANSDVFLYRNASLVASNTSYQTAGSVSDTASHEITLGNAQTGVPFTGDVAELIVYASALSTTDRQAVETYLNSKWAIY